MYDRTINKNTKYNIQQLKAKTMSSVSLTRPDIRTHTEEHFTAPRKPNGSSYLAMARYSTQQESEKNNNDGITFMYSKTSKIIQILQQSGHS